MIFGKSAKVVHRTILLLCSKKQERADRGPVDLFSLCLEIGKHKRALVEHFFFTPRNEKVQSGLNTCLCFVSRDLEAPIDLVPAGPPENRREQLLVG
ncbi:hypothetical protein DLJ51_08915 [Streptococcus sobrinus]|nr:hypothetical protein DLJ52_08910 [Streptococcus sobrinus]AWN64147.1 hypothetical protein DLJ51_08915 [Streptococcus sobrinus]